jgi:hypothetical protein
LKTYVSHTVIGIFILDIKGKVIYSKKYKDISEAADTLSTLNSGAIPAFLDIILSKLRTQ